jgi:hypothetical protein
LPLNSSDSPLYLEHVTVNSAIGKVTNCTFDAQTKSLLYEAEIYDPGIAEKIRKGLIQHVSVGADYDTLDSANVPHGLHNAERQTQKDKTSYIFLSSTTHSKKA